MKAFWKFVGYSIVFIIIGKFVGGWLAEKKVKEIKQNLGLETGSEKKVGTTKKIKAQKKIKAMYSGSRNNYINQIFFYTDGSCEFSVRSPQLSVHLGCKAKEWVAWGTQKGHYDFRGTQISNGYMDDNFILAVYFSFVGGKNWTDDWPGAIHMKYWTLYERQHQENGLLVGGANVREVDYRDNPVILKRKQ